MIEHQKLQAEYANLLRTLEMTNDENQRLITRLATNPSVNSIKSG